MKKTILTLLVAVILIPIAALYLDNSITPEQLTILKVVGITYLVTALGSFLVSEISKNYSQVDKLWSIIPLVYIWIMAYMADWQPRALLMAGVATIWGIRLTYNFHRRGGYSLRFWEGEEDYRWEVLRKNPLLQNRVVWTLFNFFFISLYQHGLLMLITLPMIVVIGSDAVALGMADVAIAVLFVGLVVYETIADQQQWNYQNEKYRLRNAGLPLNEKYARGFLTEGLWNLSRHPNYFAEQSIWVVFYMFSVVATGSWFNWTICGAVLLVMLFQGSANFSEGITAEKYPLYKKYQSLVPKFLPLFKIPNAIGLKRVARAGR
ncbi:MAG: steroid 5-alpha reductase family enzyme [Granulosicoccus sp.]|jgi:steroid 5-alpha reductase family enzyme